MERSIGLGTSLRHLLARLDGDVQAIYDELGVPFRPRFYPIVQMLLSEGTASVGALARATGVSQPAATQTIGEMVRLGLVELSTGDDARERRVGLTPAGIALADRLRPLWAAVAEAAGELDQELPNPLSATVAAAIEALARKSFRDRIRGRMRND